MAGAWREAGGGRREVGGVRREAREVHLLGQCDTEVELAQSHEPWHLVASAQRKKLAHVIGLDIGMVGVKVLEQATEGLRRAVGNVHHSRVVESATEHG